MHKEKEQKNSISNKVLEQITSEDLKPKPQWRFVVKDRLVWIVGGLAVFIGSISFSALLFNVVNTPWSERYLTHNSGTTMLLETFPYFWVGAIIIFLIFGYQSLKRTEKGYRWSLLAVTLWIVLASIVLGTAFFVVGAGKIADRFAGKFPIHRNIEAKLAIQWNNPDRGILAGTVMKLQDATITVQTLDKKLHLDISTEGLSQVEKDLLTASSEIKIIGFKIYEDDFYACKVLPWELSDRRIPLERKMKIINERNSLDRRSNECKEIKPYKELQHIYSGKPL